MKKVMWVTWERQRRNQGIAKALDAEFYEFDLSSLPRWKKYIVGKWKTFKAIRFFKPDVVIAQHPSIVLALTTLCWKFIFGYKLGIDAHNGAFAIETNNLLLKQIARIIQRYADFIIVHNQELKEKVEHIGGNLFVLPDKIPDIPFEWDYRPFRGTESYSIITKFQECTNKLFYICSFAKDEPFLEVIKAAKVVPDVNIFISGNYKKANLKQEDMPPNVFLTGRIPEKLFDIFLWKSDAAMDLTTRADCLLCGNYEAVACEKPLITSNTQAIKSWFTSGVIYTNNNQYDIAISINTMFSSLDFRHKMKSEVMKYKANIQKRWYKLLLNIQEFIEK